MHVLLVRHELRRAAGRGGGALVRRAMRRRLLPWRCHGGKVRRSMQTLQVRPARGVELAEAHSEVVSTPLLLLQLRQDALACGQLQAEEGAQSRRWVVALAFSPAPDIAVALNDTCIALAADVVLLVVVAVGCGPPRRRRRQQLRHQVVQALWGVLGGTAGGPMSHGRWPCHVKAVARCCQRRRRRRRWRDGCHRRSMTSGYGGRRLSSSSRGMRSGSRGT
mmetsp:Transcript_3673/g.10350  ORF Transcript_3673/g.10350 Transcript_3673/m.10350 type:complete len:221 (-) Transcript_3673:725-1387(-)